MALAPRAAARVSAVSPDWETNTDSVDGSQTASPYRYSDAVSTRRSSPVKRSKSPAVASAA